jgi:hypothetical protein
VPALKKSHALRVGSLLLLAALALTIAACGSSKDSSSGASASDRDTARLRLQDCLRKQGINLPTPGQGQNGPPRNFDRTKMQKAMQGPCKKYQQAAFGNISAKDRQEMRDRMVKFSSCMRQHGVDIPDIQPGQGGPPRRFNLNSPKSQAAAKACQKLIPRPPGGGRGGPGGPGGGIGFQAGPPPGGSQ